MQYGIISDIHANLEALEVVLGDMDRRRPDAVICLGDFVGYGPDPVTCVERLRPALAGAVAGNHDLAAVDALDIADFNPFAQAAILWTREQLTAPVRRYLTDLPQQITPNGFLAVHGSARDPVEEYILDLHTAQANFDAASFRVCLVGHTHVPAVFVFDGEKVTAAPLLPEQPLRLQPERRYIVNVGSVGQPRDGDARASWLLLDTTARTAEWRREEYDIAGAQAAIRDARLPDSLAERLRHGQ